MKNILQKSLLQPGASLEQILAFEPGKPETYTPSQFLNQVLEAMSFVCPASSTMLARHFRVDARKLAAAVELIAGMPYPKLREAWSHAQFERLHKQHPDWMLDRLARAVGYADPSAIWRHYNPHRRHGAARGYSRDYHEYFRAEHKDEANVKRKK